MREWIERFFFEDRWRRDEQAWSVWQSVLSYRPQVEPDLWHRGLVSGQVIRTYQHARRGTKALVNFGPRVGIRDTWWERMSPPRGRFVFVEAHWWPGPGTHSEEPVIWIDRWHSTAPADVMMRAKRHERRQARLALAEEKRAEA
jgi:hypothetical protein